MKNDLLPRLHSVYLSEYTSAPRGPRRRSSTRPSTNPSRRHRRRPVSCRSSFRMRQDLGIPHYPTVGDGENPSLKSHQLFDR